MMVFVFLAGVQLVTNTNVIHLALEGGLRSFLGG